MLVAEAQPEAESVQQSCLTHLPRWPALAPPLFLQTLQKRRPCSTAMHCRQTDRQRILFFAFHFLSICRHRARSWLAWLQGGRKTRLDRPAGTQAGCRDYNGLVDELGVVFFLHITSTLAVTLFFFTLLVLNPRYRCDRSTGPYMQACVRVCDCKYPTHVRGWPVRHRCHMCTVCLHFDRVYFP